MEIKLCQPSITQAETDAAVAALNSGWLTEGPKNEEFQKNFADYLGIKHAITVNSCASALFVAVKALNITGEVIVPSFTFPATANAVVTAGATPIFADINLETLNLDATAIENKITTKTQAVIIVHTAGQACEMDKIMALVKKHNLFLIEDSAKTIGGTFNGQKTGSFGDIGCFSFFPTKNMTTGEGGMLTTNSDELAKKMKILIAHGVERSTDANGNLVRAVVEPGYNFRMSNVLAAVGVEQLKRLDEMNARRIAWANYFNEKITNPQIIKPVAAAGASHVFQMYIIRMENGRDEMMKKLKAAGVGATIYCNPPVHQQPYYQKKYFTADDQLPNTIKAAKENIILPMYPAMTSIEIDYIINIINS